MARLLHEIEGSTRGLWSRSELLDLTEDCNFKVVIPHCVIDTYGENVSLTFDEIKKRSVPPLQKNVIYIFCRLPDVQPPLNSRIRKLLGAGMDLQYKTLQVVVRNCSAPEQSEFNELPFDVRKDVVFTNTSNEKLGWYNHRCNILWLSDTTHYQSFAPAVMTQILKAVQSFKRGCPASTFRTTIGTDPEFEIVRRPAHPIHGLDNDGVLIPASNIYREYDIGHDGHAPTGEIRPMPTPTPMKLTRNIRRLIRKIIWGDALPHGAEIWAGSGIHKGLGGHIHFGKETRENSKKLWEIMHDTVGKYMVATMPAGSAREGSTRIHARNGTDSVRTDTNHGGVEWRVPPSFIVNDKICNAVLCSVYAVTSAYFGGGIDEQHTKDKFFLKRLPLYETYRKQIDDFIEMFILHPTVLERRNILDEWDIPKIKRTGGMVMITTDLSWIKNHIPTALAPIKNQIRVWMSTNKDEADMGDVLEWLVVTPLEIRGTSNYLKIKNRFKQFGKQFLLRSEEVDVVGEQRTAYAGCNLAIWLPRGWSNMTYRVLLSNKLKKLLVDVVTEFDKGMIKVKESEGGEN